MSDAAAESLMRFLKNAVALVHKGKVVADFCPNVINRLDLDRDENRDTHVERVSSK